MSALGQKRTRRLDVAMSALPPKADIRQRDCDVSFGPQADIPPASHRTVNSQKCTKGSNSLPPYELTELRMPVLPEDQLDRLGDLEPSAAVSAGHSGNPAFVTLDNPLRYGKTKSHSLHLCSNKCVEYAAQCFFLINPFGVKIAGEIGCRLDQSMSQSGQVRQLMWKKAQNSTSNSSSSSGSSLAAATHSCICASAITVRQ